MNKLEFTVNNFSFLKIYNFKCDEKLLLDTLNEVKKIDFEDNTLNDISKLRLNNKNNFFKIHEWFQKCVDTVFFDLKLPKTFKNITITESWANKTGKNEGHHEHHHPNSYLSGVLFLTDNPSMYTVFKNRNLWYSDDFLFDNYVHDTDYGFSQYNQFNQKTEAGTLILFPSKLRHFVTNNLDENEKYSIAFNSYPEIIHDEFASYLHIKPLPYDEVLI